MHLYISIKQCKCIYKVWMIYPEVVLMPFCSMWLIWWTSQFIDSSSGSWFICHYEGEVSKDWILSTFVLLFFLYLSSFLPFFLSSLSLSPFLSLPPSLPPFLPFFFSPQRLFHLYQSEWTVKQKNMTSSAYKLNAENGFFKIILCIFCSSNPILHRGTQNRLERLVILKDMQLSML